MKLRIEQIVINYSGTSNANEENNSQYAEKYIFSTEDDLLNAVVVILTPDSGEAWSNFNERAAEAFQTVFAGKTIQKQESTAKEDGIAIMGNWQVKDDSGNSITIEFGSEIDITVKFN